VTGEETKRAGQPHGGGPVAKRDINAGRSGASAATICKRTLAQWWQRGISTRATGGVLIGAPACVL